MLLLFESLSFADYIYAWSDVNGGCDAKAFSS